MGSRCGPVGSGGVFSQTGSVILDARLKSPIGDFNCNTIITDRRC